MKGKKGTVDLVDLILENRVSFSFPRVYEDLFLFVTIPFTVETVERPFSKLKLIKAYLRPTMAQERLLDVSILFIENEKARSIDKGRIINTLTRVNARRCKNIL